MTAFGHTKIVNRFWDYYESGNNREIVPGKFVESSSKVPGKLADFF
jgi:hypothetical protein